MQLCGKLHNLGVRPRRGKGAHGATFQSLKPSPGREIPPEILGQTVHHPGSPPLSRKSGGEILADGPVELDGFWVERQGGAQLGGANPGLLTLRTVPGNGCKPIRRN